MTLMFEDTPAEAWDRNAAKRSLDELFVQARQYRSGKDYRSLLEFISHFRSYSVFNALLVHVQMPGARFVAPPLRWKRDYHRLIRLGAHPLVILKPMGPVMFVFDVSDTEPLEGAPKLPKEVTDPFAVKHGHIHDELKKTIENAKRDGINVAQQDAGSLSAGSIQIIAPGQTTKFLLREKPRPEYLSIPVLYGILLNAKQSAETQYATLVHELAHRYCGHLGSPNPQWWPNRLGLSDNDCELEAESVCFLVCQRLGIKNPSEKYLSTYVKDDDQLNKISLECVIRSAALIEQMGKEKLTLRKTNTPLSDHAI